jgi:hypothetical protein
VTGAPGSAVALRASQGRAETGRVSQPSTGGVAQATDASLTRVSQWIPSVHRKEVPRPAVCPSSPQEESHRPQTHHLLEPRSRATQALLQRLQSQRRQPEHAS